MRLHALTNENGVEVAVTDYGATLVSVKVPDREGRLADVVLGYDAPEEYVSEKAFLGGTIGRYANRISRSRFKLDGVGHTLTQNQGEHHLHGGLNGFHKVVWQASALVFVPMTCAQLRESWGTITVTDPLLTPPAESVAVSVMV